MKIYIVVYREYEEDEIVGVFSTKEKAMRAKQKHGTCVLEWEVDGKCTWNSEAQEE